ncbi:MAG: transglutaminase domain-containing protein [Myxococcales bacterium]|nr:transglutaminase domain-containing protein [Myxococcales bacterium]
MSDAPAPLPTESTALVVGKALVLNAAVWLTLRSMAGEVAILAGVLAATLAVLLARLADRRGLRAFTGAVIGLIAAAIALPVGHFVLDSTVLFGWLDSRATLIASDVLGFGLLVGGLVFALRLLAARSRGWSLLEAAAVLGAVAHFFARHRNQMIHRPLFLSDWALSHGLDPQVVLQALGVVAAAVAVLMALRRQRALKLAISLATLLLLGWLVYQFVKDMRIEVEPVVDAAQQQDDDADSKDGKSGGDGKGSNSGGGGAGNALGDGSGGGTPPPPRPVAVAVFHEDYEPQSGLLYFRQQVLSQFDGTKLVADSSGRFDADVITAFPTDAPIEAVDGPVPAFHLRVPTSMFLLVDHPQPLALSASILISPRENPSPRRFVAAYDAVSLAVSAPVTRLVGRASVPADWSPEMRAHYLTYPDDPRYRALSNEIVREMDPRFAGDDLMKAYAIKRYLETEGFYTRRERHLGGDPTGSFLFGSMRGYCVHFAHSAANLFRSQGIAARVAVGYAVDNNARGAGSAVLILGDRAHAWPEIHLEGVGWMPFDVYPERSDEPPPRMVDQSLESLLGELARDDPTGGRGADPDAELHIPWRAIGLGFAFTFGGLLLFGYAVKISRRLAPAMRPAAHRRLFAATLDRFSDIGDGRRPDETRERHAARLAALAPSLVPLTRTHLRLTLGHETPGGADELRALAQQVRREYSSNVPRWRRALGWLNPVGWWFTR